MMMMLMMMLMMMMNSSSRGRILIKKKFIAVSLCVTATNGYILLVIGSRSGYRNIFNDHRNEKFLSYSILSHYYRAFGDAI